jgi:DNA (cytosine-5)-methyltransferase 1
MIPVVDLFAGPGGLGEGFSAFSDEKHRRRFRVVLSIEKDADAHETLRLRSFFRQFARDKVPDEYYACLAGHISIEELYRFPHLKVPAKTADWEARLAELGNEREYPSARVDQWIRNALVASGGYRRPWVLIGGPPCQAYSVAGRARMRRADPRKYAADPRHILYRQYLRILAQHQPAVFVMENVKGLLSSELAGMRIFDRILNDLSDPGAAIDGLLVNSRRHRHYRIYPCVDYDGSPALFDGELYEPEDFVVRCELHGVPQTRHRVILIGVRDDLCGKPVPLEFSRTSRVPAERCIGDLPPVRSRLSGGDSPVAWRTAIAGILREDVLGDPRLDDKVRLEISSTVARLQPDLSGGSEHYPGYQLPAFEPPGFQERWFGDERMETTCNHNTRAHIAADLQRYVFAACFGAVHGRSPKLEAFPEGLLPEHKNITHRNGGFIFRDRFRVQVAHEPATTITSHIRKDGHYYIHYDPLQCRSLTVREASRLQTFPDNYFFAGARGSQYQQVGNAVPPLLALRIAGLVLQLLNSCC